MLILNKIEYYLKKFNFLVTKKLYLKTKKFNRYNKQNDNCFFKD